jgi:hypothetical protein
MSNLSDNEFRRGDYSPSQRVVVGETLSFHRLLLLPTFEDDCEPGEKLFRLRRCDAAELPIGCQNFVSKYEKAYRGKFGRRVGLTR